MSGKCECEIRERTGSIVKCKDGKLYARITYKGEDGERHDITRRTTDRKDARRIIKELLNDLEDRGEKAIEADRMKFSEAVEVYRDKKAIPPVIRNGRRIAGLKKREIEFLKLKTCGEHIYNQPLPKKSQKQGDHMRKHYFLSSLVVFVAGFALSTIVDGRRLASMAPGTLSNSFAPEVAAQSARQSSTTQNWEYRVLERLHYRNDQRVGVGLEQDLNQLGKQGFEVCGIIQIASPNPYEATGVTIISGIAQISRL